MAIRKALITAMMMEEEIGRGWAKNIRFKNRLVVIIYRLDYFTYGFYLVSLPLRSLYSSVPC